MDEFVVGLKAPGTRWPVLDEADGCIMRVVSSGHGCWNDEIVG